MAGKVRQPIDLASLSDYIEEYVPSIALPISVLQVFVQGLLEFL